MRAIYKKNMGQATIEYAMVIALIAGILFLFLDRFKFPLLAFEQKLQKEYASIYKYGDKDTCGFDDPAPCEGPKRHPRIGAPGNGRMFARSALK